MSHYSEPRPPFTYIDDVMANMIADSHPCGPAPLAHNYVDGICEDCGDEDWDYEPPARDDLLSDHEDAMDELRNDGA